MKVPKFQPVSPDKKITMAIWPGPMETWFMESGLGGGWIPFAHRANSRSVITQWFENRRDLQKVIELIRLEKSFHEGDAAMLAHLEGGVELANRLDDALGELRKLVTPELVDFERILVEFDFAFLRDRENRPVDVVMEVIEREYSPSELLLFLSDLFADYSTTPVEPEKLERISAAISLFDVLYC